MKRISILLSVLVCFGLYAPDSPKKSQRVVSPDSVDSFFIESPNTIKLCTMTPSAHPSPTAQAAIQSTLKNRVLTAWNAVCKSRSDGETLDVELIKKQVTVLKKDFSSVDSVAQRGINLQIKGLKNDLRGIESPTENDEELYTFLCEQWPDLQSAPQTALKIEVPIDRWSEPQEDGLPKKDAPPAVRCLDFGMSLMDEPSIVGSSQSIGLQDAPDTVSSSYCDSENSLSQTSSDNESFQDDTDRSTAMSTSNEKRQKSSFLNEMTVMGGLTLAALAYKYFILDQASPVSDLSSEESTIAR